MNISMENEQDSQMTVSGVFRTVSGGAQPAQQLVGAGFASNALPPAHSRDPFSRYPNTPSPRYNRNNHDNSFPKFSNSREQEQWYNEQTTIFFKWQWQKQITKKEERDMVSAVPYMGKPFSFCITYN